MDLEKLGQLAGAAASAAGVAAGSAAAGIDRLKVRCLCLSSSSCYLLFTESLSS
jgi:hypothetical protein